MFSTYFLAQDGCCLGKIYSNISCNHTIRRTFNLGMANETASQSSTIFLLEGVVNYFTFLQLTRGTFGHVLDSIFALFYWIYFYWILILYSFSYWKVLYSTLFSRDKITIKVQLGKSFLVFGNLLTKLTIELHTLLYLLVRGYNK